MVVPDTIIEFVQSDTDTYGVRRFWVKNPRGATQRLGIYLWMPRKEKFYFVPEPKIALTMQEILDMGRIIERINQERDKDGHRCECNEGTDSRAGESEACGKDRKEASEA